MCNKPERLYVGSQQYAANLPRPLLHIVAYRAQSLCHFVAFLLSGALQDSSLLTNPLVSPTYLDNFSGLCQHGMIIVAGGVELMRPDIAAFAAKVSAAGVPVKYHEGPGQPHSYMVLGLPHLLKEGRVLIDYVAEVACR